MKYENNVAEAAIEIIDPAATAAVCCFWTPRSDRVLRASLPPDVAVIGNSYHSAPTRPRATANDMRLSAEKIKRALAWNPQIEFLWLYGAFHQIAAMCDALAMTPTEAVSQTTTTNRQGEPICWARCMLETRTSRVEYALPKPVAPSRFPTRHRVLT